MRKYLIYILCSISIAVCTPAFANVETGVAAIPENYYIGVDGKSSAESILDALFAKIKDHTVIDYDDLEIYYEQTDFYADTVWDLYSTCRFTMAEANKAQSAVCDGWNKEHVIPQSWFSKGNPMRSDLFHVYPTDARVNNFRGNDPYGEVNGPAGTGYKDNYKNHGLGKFGSNTSPGYTGRVYEPDDEYKGDFARIYFYMVARYRDRNLTSSGGDAVFTSSKTNLTTFAKNLFMKWHRQDPVSQKEVDRNEAVYKLQKNRNPFVDYPELAEYIWGDRVGQSVDLSKMVPTCDGGGVTPVVVVKHGVTWSVNGTDEQTDSVKENFKPAMPPMPVSCSAESAVFMGWTDAPIADTTDEAPAVLYTASADFPVVTEDVTYYAVFAHQEIAGGNPQTYVFDANHSEGWTNMAFKSNSYWVLKEGQYIESPSIDLSGLQSVTMTMRSYGGGTFNTVNIIANSSTIGSISAKSNSLAPQTWTKTAVLNGMSTLRFEPQNANTSYGPAFSVISIDATGATVSYSRYITSCQQTTEVERVCVNTPAQKILVGGQIYILRGEHLYTIQGQLINHK